MGLPRSAGRGRRSGCCREPDEQGGLDGKRDRPIKIVRALVCVCVSWPDVGQATHRVLVQSPTDDARSFRYRGCRVVLSSDLLGIAWVNEEVKLL
jgi:hypothetical protein